MSAKINLGVGIGTFAVMLIMSLSVLYFTNQGIKQGEQLKTDFQNFVEQWTERVRIGNTNTNNTQKYIVEGVDEIKSLVKQEFSNLTAHRLITNATFDKIQNILNETKGITSQQYDDQSQKRVDDILGNMTEKFDILFKGLNISATDTDTVAHDAIEKLQKELDELENRSKTLDNLNESQ